MSKQYKVKMMKTDEVLALSSSNKITIDNRLKELLKGAYLGDFLCHSSLILIEGIKPFSFYKPEISKAFKDHFHYRLASGFPPSLYVYQKHEKFIMSDDYNAYNLYLSEGFKEVPCTVLGDPTGKYVIKKGKPFKLDPMSDPIFISS